MGTETLWVSTSSAKELMQMLETTWGELFGKVYRPTRLTHVVSLDCTYIEP